MPTSNKRRKFIVHTFALLAMLTAAAALYPAAQANSRAAESGLLLLFAAANATILFV